ncbi:MAG TPA: cyclopropane-fatty-acyl-phospholipid synthase family protein [Mycobacteriales bacterium]|nr:cyclopropane-fatty-acyl-phospholipid synthase family protein [Mycobacteriales bacterium]
MTSDVADAIAELVAPMFGGRLPVAIRAWDGSSAGPDGAPVAVLNSPRALAHIAWAPGELGMARAYIAGDLDVEGDIAAGLSAVWDARREALRRRPGTASPRSRLDARTVLAGLRLLAGNGALRRPAPPDGELRLRGRLHTKRRDAAVIHHHYDVSNTLYSLLLDENMAYSCGYWTSDDPAYDVADSQRDKLDMICRKLGLAPGKHLLDVGCGWGALSIHAAREYGARVTGITISAEQLAFATARVDELDLGHLVDVRLLDYRDLAGGPYDAISVIEMGEHVGKGNYPAFAASLHGLLADEGRLLVQQMSRSGSHPGGGPFIERYITPDMHMRPVHETIAILAAAGFEVRDVHAMREHYVHTVAAWQRQLDRRWDEVVAAVGVTQARVWRLYLAGGALAFAENRMGVDQILSVKPTSAGISGMPPTRTGWEPSPSPAQRRRTPRERVR